MTGIRSVREAKINLEAHSFPRNLNSLVHDQEASQHYMLSNTHRKSSGLIFALHDNQILRRNLCECYVRANYTAMTSVDILG